MEDKFAYKNMWDNPYSGRLWYECSSCKSKVSKKAIYCERCGVKFVTDKTEDDVFEDILNGKGIPKEPRKPTDYE